jgi:hypothetical protein
MSRRHGCVGWDLRLPQEALERRIYWCYDESNVRRAVALLVLHRQIRVMLQQLQYDLSVIIFEHGEYR